MNINKLALGMHLLATFLCIILVSYMLGDFSNGYEGVVLIFGVLLINIFMNLALPKDKRLFVLEEKTE